jgi:DNA primase
MAGRIPRDFIDDLVARSDIVDIIDARVKLKKAGKNHQACCPFHNEKSPSFSVSQEKQFYYCFGCGAKGNVISFLMEFDRLEFPEAIEELAKTYGMDVPREKGGAPGPTPQQKSQREQDYQLMESVTRFFQHQLKNHPQAPKVIDYLKGRGLSGDVVKAWDMGFAPPEWDAVLKTFGSDEHKQSRLLELKLISQNDNNRRFDFFRNRVMFPIRDKRGRVVGFGGRVMEDDGPKYLNSPETPIFHKGFELFGLYQARKNNRKLDRLLVVEGYMDVVALSQFDIQYAVAALGTATTPEHIQAMFKSTSEIVCCYDGDRAGREAAWRALENALPFLKDGVAMKFLFLPDGEDPDTMVRKVGKEAFEALLDQAVPLSKFFFDNLLQRHSVASNEGKAALKSEATPLINKIQGDNQRELLQIDLSRLFGEEAKETLARDIKDANSRKAPRKMDYQAPTKIKQSPLRMMLRLLLDQPALASENKGVQLAPLQQTAIPGIPLLIDLHSYCYANPKATTGMILEAFREHPNSKHLAQLLESDLIAQSMNLRAEYKDCYKKLLSWHFTARLDELMAKAKFSELSIDEQQELNLLVTKLN